MSQKNKKGPVKSDKSNKKDEMMKDKIKDIKEKSEEISLDTEEKSDETKAKSDESMEAKGSESEDSKKESESEITLDSDESNETKKDKKDLLIEELNDKVKRQMAEFENFRRRSEKEKQSMYDMGAVAVLEKILPVVDNFERGLESAGDDPFAEGMKMIYKQLMTSFDEMGVAAIPAVGETFDPDVHNAVMHEEDDSVGENTVTKELQRGYKYHDTVVRHSLVSVAN